MCKTADAIGGFMRTMALCEPAALRYDIDMTQPSILNAADYADALITARRAKNTVFLILLVLWFLGFLAFHVTTGLIHILLIVAVIALILHFVRGRSTV